MNAIALLGRRVIERTWNWSSNGNVATNFIFYANSFGR